MNSAITFPPPRPTLRLTRSPHPATSEEKWAATLAEERRRLVEDQEELRVRESNLREYEARLRALQAEIEAGSAASAAPARTPVSATPFVRPSSRMPFEGDAALHGAWDKLHRAREILEAEQAHMRDERIILASQQNEVKRREDAATAREERLAEREKLIAAAVTPADVAAAKSAATESGISAVARITSAPFAMARSVFGGKK